MPRIEKGLAQVSDGTHQTARITSSRGSPSGDQGEVVPNDRTAPGGILRVAQEDQGARAAKQRAAGTGMDGSEASLAPLLRVLFADLDVPSRRIVGEDSFTVDLACRAERAARGVDIDVIARPRAPVIRVAVGNAHLSGSVDEPRIGREALAVDHLGVVGNLDPGAHGHENAVAHNDRAILDDLAGLHDDLHVLDRQGRKLLLRDAVGAAHGCDQTT